MQLAVCGSGWGLRRLNDALAASFIARRMQERDWRIGRTLQRCGSCTTQREGGNPVSTSLKTHSAILEMVRQANPTPRRTTGACGCSPGP